MSYIKLCKYIYSNTKILYKTVLNAMIVGYLRMFGISNNLIYDGDIFCNYKEFNFTILMGVTDREINHSDLRYSRSIV